MQGIWVEGIAGKLCLWAEDPDLPRDGARDASAPAAHPSACQSSELADLLAGLPGPGAEAARKGVDHELTLLLPTAGDGPLPSPEAIRPETGSSGPSRPSLPFR